MGPPLTLRAAREVVLSLGAIETPKLLMQSGIGDPTHLETFGIKPIQALPGVGNNLHDHVSFACIWEGTGEPLPMTPRSQTACFWKSSSSLSAPNFYTYAIGVPFPTSENAAWSAPPYDGFSLIVGMSPHSRGSVRLTGADADAPVSIDANYLGDTGDMKDLVDGISRAREIGNSDAMRKYAKREVHPGPISNGILEAFFRNGLVTFWHQCCTARMGTDDGSVVDSHLRIHGINRLRVADASVLPHVSRGNTMAPCVVIGENAANFIRQAK